MHPRPKVTPLQTAGCRPPLDSDWPRWTSRSCRDSTVERSVALRRSPADRLATGLRPKIWNLESTSDTTSFYQPAAERPASRPKPRLGRDHHCKVVAGGLAG